MGQNSSCNDRIRNSYYRTAGAPSRIASGILQTDGAGGAIVRNGENIAGARIVGTNVEIFFRSPPPGGARYMVSVRDRSAAPHALPEQYSDDPFNNGFRIVSAVDFSVSARTLIFRVEPL